VTAGAPAYPSAVRTYRKLRHCRLVELLGRWASELEPQIFQRVDVSPHILAEVGIGAPGAVAPMFVAHVTVDDMIAAGALG
jgi:hypothetical protein